MAKTFLIAIIAIVAVMAALVLLPGFNSQPASNQAQVSVQYTRQQFEKTDSGLASTNDEVLTIENDGSATYVKTGGQPDRFTIGGEDMKLLKDLILESGFMQIPETNYPAQADAANITTYTLKVQAGDDSKTITWARPGADVPFLINEAGTRLDAIIEQRN
jgi:hypothetical protein